MKGKNRTRQPTETKTFHSRNKSYLMLGYLFLSGVSSGRQFAIQTNSEYNCSEITTVYFGLRLILIKAIHANQRLARRSLFVCASDLLFVPDVPILVLVEFSFHLKIQINTNNLIGVLLFCVLVQFVELFISIRDGQNRYFLRCFPFVLNETVFSFEASNSFFKRQSS